MILHTKLFYGHFTYPGFKLAKKFREKSLLSQQKFGLEV